MERRGFLFFLPFFPTLAKKVAYSIPEIGKGISSIIVSARDMRVPLGIRQGGNFISESDVIANELARINPMINHLFARDDLFFSSLKDGIPAHKNKLFKGQLPLEDIKIYGEGDESSHDYIEDEEDYIEDEDY